MEIISMGIGLIILEVLFWLLVGKWVYNRRKRKKSIWNKEP